jgi:3-hydroxyisobutyrate dehydrogenase-like beta-hydroxyacid dehydrogenase
MDRKRRKNVGVIGLGIIGSRVAASLRKAGFHVYVWNRSPRAEPNFLASPAEVAAICNVVQLFVADAQALYEVIDAFGERLGASHTIISSATIAPAASVHAAGMVQGRGARFLEAPFTGSRLAAEKGELVYFLGGDDETIGLMEEVLKGSSKARLKMGEVGAASTLKIATNMMVAVNVLALAEALALVRYLNLPPEKLREALEHHAVRSPLIDMKLGAMISGDYDAHFSIKHMFKDVQIGRDIAENLGLQLTATSIAESLLYRCIEEGWGDLDFSALARFYGSDAAAPAESGVSSESVEVRTPSDESAAAEEESNNIAVEETRPQKSAVRRLFGF